MLKLRKHNLPAMLATLPAVLLCAGCFKISVAPTCPDTLAVGESGTVAANPTTPGAIATYQWEVSPTTAGSFEDAASETTTFTASAEGTATITMSASDGLFQDVATCVTTIGGTTTGALSVSLAASPASPTVDDVLTLTCLVTAGDATATLTIDQLDGAVVSLTEQSPGVSTVTSAAEGTYTFRCTGQTADGQSSAPATIAVTVTAAGRGGGRGNSGRAGQ